MHAEKINESIEVLAAFRSKGMEPMVFKWAGKKYSIKKINLVHVLKDGREWTYYYSVSGEGAMYRLAYYPLTFKWMLEEIWLE
jgi:hypothetical protein